MGIFDSLFGSSQNVVNQKPQVLEGLEGLTPLLASRATEAANRPYARNPNPRLAPMSASTRAGIGSFRGIATDPRYGQQMGQAEGMIGSSTDDANLQALIGSLSRSIRPERTGAARWNQPGVAASYMSPYQDQVLDRLLRREDERTGERRAGLDAKLAGKKAFGDRADIGRAQFERDEEDRKKDIIADQLQRGYESGANIFRTDEDRSSALARANADRALEAERLMTTGIGQGSTAEMSRLAGRRAAGNDLSQLADRWRTGMTENARNLLGIGNIEQQDAQRHLDLATKDFEEQRDYPENRADFLARTLYGAPRGSTTTTPGPSMASQLLGTGIGIAGLGSGFGWWKKGGAVKLASGGDPMERLSDSSLKFAATNPMLPPDLRAKAKRVLDSRKMDAPREPKGFQAEALPPTFDLPPTDYEELPPPTEADFGGIGMAESTPAPAPKASSLVPPQPLTPAMPSLAMTEGMPPPSPVQAPAQDSPEEPDGFGSILEKLLAAQEPNKGMILARIGAAMAAGQKPGFLANVGEGIGAGARAMEDDRSRRVRALGTAATIEERRAAGKERAEDRKTQNEIRKEQAQALKDYREALAGRGKWTVGGTNADGDVVLVDTNSGESKIVSGVKPKATGSAAGGVYERKRQAYLTVHPGDEQGALDYASGRRQMTEAEKIRAATAGAKAKAANEMNPTRAKEVYDTEYAALMQALGASGQPTAAPSAPNVSRETTGAVSQPKPAQSSGAPSAAVDYLKKNPTPQMRAAFDAKYGKGAAAKALGE